MKKIELFYIKCLKKVKLYVTIIKDRGGESIDNNFNGQFNNKKLQNNVDVSGNQYND